jgi:hypothetical protein
VKTSRIVALIIGCLMLLPGIGLLIGGAALGIANAAGRNESGYFEATPIDVRTATAAITAETPALTTDLRTSAWLIDALDTDLRLRVTAPGGDTHMFVGIGPAVAVDAYLADVSHDEITGVTDGTTPVYRTRAGSAPVSAPPAGQTFWTAKTSGPGTRQLAWSPSDGQWSVVIMNADGSPGVAAAVTVEIKAGFLLPLALTMLVIGVVITLGGVALIVIGAVGRPADRRGRSWSSDSNTKTGVVAGATADPPTALTAHLDSGLSDSTDG